MDLFQTVYFDKTVLISELYLKIFKYYLPLATSKTIFFKEISHIIYHRGRVIDVIWGASSDKLKDWFPFDQKRTQRKGYFQVVMKDKSLRPCFSPIDPERAFNVLWMNHSQEGNKWKEQCMRPKEPIILLSSRVQDLHISVQPEREQIITEKRDPQTDQDQTITEMRKVMIRQREPFEELTNFQVIKEDKTTGKKNEKRFSPVKILEFEEESLEEYGSQRENNELVDEGDFEDLN